MVAFIEAQVYSTRALKASTSCTAQPGSFIEQWAHKDRVASESYQGQPRSSEIKTLLEEQQQIHRRIDNCDDIYSVRCRRSVRLSRRG